MEISAPGDASWKKAHHHGVFEADWRHPLGLCNMFFIHPSIKEQEDGWRGCSFVFDMRRLCMSALGVAQCVCYFLIITRAAAAAAAASAAVAAAAEVKRSSSKEKHISFNTLPYKYITDKLLVISTASCHALVNKNPLWCAAAAHTHSQSVHELMPRRLLCVLRAARQRTSISLQKRISTSHQPEIERLRRLSGKITCFWMRDVWWGEMGACRDLRAFLCLILCFESDLV